MASTANTAAARHGRQRRVLAGNQERGQRGEQRRSAEGGGADADDLVKAAPLVPALVQAGEQARNGRQDADGSGRPERQSAV